LTPANPVIECLHDFVVETYVQTHGHSIAHKSDRTGESIAPSV
jgi:hypothetical protein